MDVISVICEGSSEVLANLVRHMLNRAILPADSGEYGDFATWLVKFLERHVPKG